MGATSIAQIPHVRETLQQTLDELCRARLCALVEAGHGEDNVVGLRVVARSVSVWEYGSVAAEHLNGCRNLRGGDGGGGGGASEQVAFLASLNTVSNI